MHRSVSTTVMLSVALYGTGCAYYATSHLPYAPLLNRGGQVDISARAGVGVPGGAEVAVNAAVAPVDGFEVLANVDLNVGDDDTHHYGGGLAIGTFVPTDTFRLEFIAGANGGYADGVAIEVDSPSSRVYRINGPYVAPFAQLLLGFEQTHFIFAAGVRFSGFLSTATRTSATEPTGETAYDRAYVEPIATVQIPIDFVRIELISTLPIFVAGDAGPTPLAIDSPVQWYFAAGVGFQWDAFGAGEPEPEPEYVPTPVYAPTPTPSPTIEPTPAVPSGYETSPPPPATTPTPTTPTTPAPSEPAPAEDPAPSGPASPFTPSPE